MSRAIKHNRADRRAALHAARQGLSSTALAVLASAVLSLAVAASAATAAPTNETIYQKSISSKLNSTGRAINMPVPLKDDGNVLGEVIVRIDPDDSVLVPKAMLVEKLTGALDKPSLERLHGVRDVNGQVSLNDLKAAGFNLHFDPNALELRFLATVDQRATGTLSLTRQGGPSVSASAAKPAMIAGYLNVIGAADHVYANDLRRDDATSGRLDLQGVFRMYNIVLENEMTYEGDVDTNTCPTGATCTVQHTAGLKRRRSRLIYDFPDQLLRLQIGDADTWGTGLQRAPDVLGVALEHSPRKLRPGENIRPTGRSSFRLERPSDVEVVINGAIVQRLRLRPGNYNLSDLPLATGANEVQLIISDDTGERRTLSFTTFFDGNLLGAGKTEWSLSGGAPSYFRDNERQYRDDQTFASGFLRYGITDQITAEAHAQGDNNVQMGGGGLFTATPWGFWGGQGAVSNSDSGTGYAVNVNWDLINYNGLVGGAFNTRETLRLAAEYRSTHFRIPGEFLTTASGILYPQFNYWLRLTGTYSVPVAWGITATASARYQFADDKQIALSPYTVRGDRYGVDLTLTAPLTQWASGSLTLGYSNESYLRFFSNPTSEPDPDFRVMARIYIRPDEKTRVSANYDSLNKSAYVSAYRGEGRGLDRWETTVDVQHSGVDERANVGGSVNYYGNRAEVAVQHTAGFNNVDKGRVQIGDADQRSTVRVGTAIAFADGKFGVGQPIRGNGFAVVYPHESIQGKEITVGTADAVRAKANGWGNAVVTDVPAYAASSIPVDVANLPVGYSLGAGAFDTFAPYRGGYALEVGSAFSVSAFGTLMGTDDEPLALLSGTASPVDEPARKVTLFTNSAGKFAAEGLAPGKWVIEMATDGAPTRYEIEVPKGTDGLFKVGTLKPSGRG